MSLIFIIIHTLFSQQLREKIGQSEPDLDNTVSTLAQNLKTEVNRSLKGENGNGVVSKLKYRISRDALSDIDNVVEKVEEKRYDSALCDTLKALMQVYTDPDPIGKVVQGEHG